MPKKILTLLRHAEAQSAGTSDSDHARQLTTRGAEQARALGLHMQRHNLIPEHILCSTATRTRQTLDCMRETQGFAAHAEFMARLYPTNVHTAVQIIQGTVDTVNRLLLIGHNPGIHQLAAQFTQEAEDHLLEEVMLHYPPCTLSVLSFAVHSWQEVELHCAKLEGFLTPQNIERMQLSGVA